MSVTEMFIGAIITLCIAVLMNVTYNIGHEQGRQSAVPAALAPMDSTVVTYRFPPPRGVKPDTVRYVCKEVK